MSWKYEEPLEEETADDPAPRANPVENGSHEAGDAPASPSPIESNHRQAFRDRIHLNRDRL